MDAKIHEVGKLFDTKLRLVVPLYQRPYVWTKELQWEPLWTDIRKLAEALATGVVPRPHFLGAVVVDADPKPLGYLTCHIVVDGQQRLTTIQLFLEALADNYELFCDGDHGDKKVYADMARGLVRNSNVLDGDVNGEFKIWPMNVDQAAFKAVMEAGSPQQMYEVHATDDKVLGSSIAEAYEFFYGAIRDWLLAQDDLDSAVKRLFEVIQNHMQIAVIDLKNSVDPQLIFETLNARGTPLDPSDLIKNFLFHQLALENTDGEELYAEYWAPFDAEHTYWSGKRGRGATRRAWLDTFIFHYLTMQSRDVVQVGKLYSEYRDFYEKTPLSTVEQLAHIRTYGDIYRSLDTLPPGTSDATFMYRLRQMDVTTVMPFVLRLKGDATLPASDGAGIMKHLESYLVRRMVCQMSVKSYNQLFVELLKATDAKGLSPAVVRDRMLSWDDPTTVWPDDKMFHTAWMEYRAYGWIAQARVRMILEALEPMVRSKKAEDVMLLQEALTIEHLMPQSWGAHYPLPQDVDSEKARAEREEYIHTFGNLTLLTKTLNPSVSNGAWVRANDKGVDKGKRSQILHHSNLGINSMLLDFEQWDEDAIHSRGELLFKAAKKLWPHPGNVE